MRGKSPSISGPVRAQREEGKNSSFPRNLPSFQRCNRAAGHPRQQLHMGAAVTSGQWYAAAAAAAVIFLPLSQVGAHGHCHGCHTLVILLLLSLYLLLLLLPICFYSVALILKQIILELLLCPFLPSYLFSSASLLHKKSMPKT